MTQILKNVTFLAKQIVQDTYNAQMRIAQEQVLICCVSAIVQAHS